MKIAFFSDCYLDLTGGIVSSINAQKAALEKLGHTVYVFSTGFPKTKSELRNLARKNIFLVPSCKLFFRGLTPVSRRPKVIERWLRQVHPELRDFDVFYVHYEAGCSIAGLRLGHALGIPTVQVMHGREDMGETNLIPYGLRTFVACNLNWFHSWYLPHSAKVKKDNFLADSIAKAKMWTLMVNHVNYADLVITPSAQFKKKLAHYGVTKDIKVFPNGINPKHFPAQAKVKTFDGDEELRIVWHSRVSAEKRMMPFLRALLLIKGRYRLDVFGGGGDFFRAKRFSRRHHLNVIFHGNVPFDDLQEYIAKAHLDVLVSYGFDTFGMTLIEAEVNATPAMICDPDLEETIPEGSFIISKDETPAAMAKSINELFKHPELVNQMSQIMLKHRDEVLIDNHIKELIKLFKSL